jgi:metal-responsive CopG/Arc/MetJ family transcriptional regulator
MKFAISVPDELFASVDAQVEKMGITRSQFFADAAKAYLEQVTLPERVAELNAILDQIGYDGSEDAVIARYGAAFLQSLPQEDWGWEEGDS